MGETRHYLFVFFLQLAYLFLVFTTVATQAASNVVASLVVGTALKEDSMLTSRH